MRDDPPVTAVERGERVVALRHVALVAGCLDTAASLTLALGRPFETARLLGASDRLHDELGSVHEHFERAEHDKTRARARSSLGDDVYEAEYELGRGLSLGEAAEFALTAIET